VVNKTIVEGLRPYALGEKLRTLRLRKGMGLVELGKHTGLSAAMLSKLERGKLFPGGPMCTGCDTATCQPLPRRAAAELSLSSLDRPTLRAGNCLRTAFGSLSAYPERLSCEWGRAATNKPRRLIRVARTKRSNGDPSRPWLGE
jgi:helix-turn-helix protein